MDFEPKPILNENQRLARDFAARFIDETTRQQFRIAQLAGHPTFDIDPNLRDQAVLATAVQVHKLIVAPHHPLAQYTERETLYRAATGTINLHLGEGSINPSASTRGLAEESIDAILALREPDSDHAMAYLLDKGRELAKDKAVRPNQIFQNPALYADLIRSAFTPEQVALANEHGIQRMTPQTYVTLLREMHPDAPDSVLIEAAHNIIPPIKSATAYATKEYIERFWGEIGFLTLPPRLRSFYESFESPHNEEVQADH